MNGKSYSLPLGMLLRKFYCAGCGEKLERERTHRVVTKDDADYYLYHDMGSFPRRDYDVYEHQFRCPCCGAVTAYHAQCVIAKLQRKQGSPVLDTMAGTMEQADFQKAVRRGMLVKSLLQPLLFAAICYGIYWLANSDKSIHQRLQTAPVFLITWGLLTARGLIRNRRRFQTLNQT